MTKKRVRAIIIKQGSVLLIKRVFDDREYWVFPGGGVELNETNKEALSRECWEELGVKIEIVKLFTKEKSEKKETFGDEEYFYEVNIVGGVLGTGDGPEHKQSEHYKGKYIILWENVDLLGSIDLKPNSIRDLVFKNFKS